jgi:hypothetical protein
MGVNKCPVTKHFTMTESIEKQQTVLSARENAACLARLKVKYYW